MPNDANPGNSSALGLAASCSLRASNFQLSTGVRLAGVKASLRAPNSWADTASAAPPPPVKLIRIPICHNPSAAGRAQESVTASKLRQVFSEALLHQSCSGNKASLWCSCCSHVSLAQRQPASLSCPPLMACCAGLVRHTADTDAVQAQ